MCTCVISTLYGVSVVYQEINNMIENFYYIRPIYIYIYIYIIDR